MNDLEMLLEMQHVVTDVMRDKIDHRLVRIELYPDRSGQFFNSDAGKTLFSWGEGYKNLFRNFSNWIRQEVRQR